MSVNKLKKTLNKFSQKDSEFAKFLTEDDSSDDVNPQLMDIDNDDDNKSDISDINQDDDNDDKSDYSDVIQDDDSDVNDESGEGSNIGSHNKTLVVASDDEYSDVADTDSDSDSALKLPPTNKSKSDKPSIITIKMVNSWRSKLQRNSIEAVKLLVVSFRAAVNFTSDSSEDCQFIVKGGTVYNAIISVCLVELLPALNNILSDSINNRPIPSKVKSNKNKGISDSQSGKGNSKSDSQSQECKFVTSRNWRGVKASVKSYILDMLRLLRIVGKDEVMLDLMKHAYDLCIFIAAFPQLHKPAIKKCIELWSTSTEEAIRIIALRCILTIMPHLSDKMAEFTLSKMYVSFARNSRFTSATTLPNISYMRRSLVEILATRPSIAYRSSFLNIRQMARLLHSALKFQNKEVKQSICNWQFVHPLCMYCILVGRLHGDEYINSLAHPLVEIILGTIRLIEGASYFPLRIAFVRSLIHLSSQTHLYIPLAPYILEILDFPALWKTPKQSSIKHLNMDCILRTSKAELKEKAFCDCLVDAAFELSLFYLSNHSNSIAFPEISLPFLIQLKKFGKKCKVAAYTRKMKLLLGIIEDNSGFVENIRKNCSVNLADQNSVNSVETKIGEANPPIKKYYEKWLVISIKQKEMLANPKQKDSENFPQIIRPPIRPKASAEDREQFEGLFANETDSQDEEEDDDNERFEIKKKKVPTATLR